MAVDLEHPSITRINRTGYANMIAQDEHCGIDYFGSEILLGDKFYEFDGETVLDENLEKYLVEVLGFEIKEAI
ncbi:YqaI family protein [Aquibacillus rhizosphaerae]|uniref:YqaI-like protein n=1 Tax=Aquibacillus rhizosphaerae TaxID=3051431 RepID=A0ABT7LAA2_9BACI|nr:hypothetical protein [Aquibacillus sp. LR5S19]MDL4842804.1 hypothetical protein [Aquibacillus sp. LR5S19]